MTVEHGSGAGLSGAQAKMAAGGVLWVAVFHHPRAAGRGHFQQVRQGGQIGCGAQPLARYVVVAAYGKHPSGRRGVSLRQERCPPDAAPQLVRPTICAVAISSSSSAMAAQPGVTNGSSCGFSEYLSRIDGLTLCRLTWPMVQPAKRRSVISW